jgi:precorrin-8X/cobalt-precorrin-8 methylmutase
MEFHTDFKPSTIVPHEIVEQSFSMVTEELGPHSFTDEQFPIVRRVIHTSADFELGRSMVFHDLAVKAGIAAIRSGKAIIPDVNMVGVGISKPNTQRFGCEIKVYISDPEVVEEAAKQHVTRAILATRKAVLADPDGIYAVGNAPTALLELIRLVKAGIAKPSLIVGVPVGFVSAAESKAELMKLDIPFISNHGRKGGSPTAVAVINALAVMANQEDR